MKVNALRAVLNEYHKRLNFYAESVGNDEKLRQLLQSAAKGIEECIGYIEPDSKVKSAALEP